MKNYSTTKEGQYLTAVWRNGGFSAKFNGSSSIELLCKIEDLCFDCPAIANPKNVTGKFKKRTIET